MTIRKKPNLTNISAPQSADQLSEIVSSWDAHAATLLRKHIDWESARAVKPVAQPIAPGALGEMVSRITNGETLDVPDMDPLRLAKIRMLRTAYEIAGRHPLSHRSRRRRRDGGRVKSLDGSGARTGGGRFCTKSPPPFAPHQGKLWPRD